MWLFKKYIWFLECSWNHKYVGSLARLSFRASLTLQETRSSHDSMNWPKMNSLFIFTFNYKYLESIYSLGIKLLCFFKYVIVLTVLLECKTEKRNSQYEHGHKRLVLYVRLRWGSPQCQSQHQCHFWRMNSMFEAYCTGNWVWQLSIKFMYFMRLWTVAKKSIDSLKVCFWKCQYLS